MEHKGTVKQMKGDLLAYTGVLVHQVNTLGIMGAGVAAQIRSKILTAEQYLSYMILCWERGSELLGEVQFLECGDRIIANCFGQAKIAKNGEVATDYDALQKALVTVRKFAEEKGLPVYIPGYIGCGLAGGDWTGVVFPMIQSVFAGAVCEVTIVYFDPSLLLTDLDGKHNGEILTVPFMQFGVGTPVASVINWYSGSFTTH